MDPDTPATERRYYGNYPYEQRQYLTDQRKSDILWSVGLSISTAAIVWYLATSLGSGGGILTFQLLGAFSGLVLLFCLLCIVLYQSFIHETSITLLYCGYDVGVFYMGGLGAYTSNSGRAISRNLKQLDELADRLKVKAIYDYGLEKADPKVMVRWHDASEAMTTISVLRAHLEDNSDELEDGKEVCDDLGSLERGLRLAAEKDIQVCFQFIGAWLTPKKEDWLPHGHK